MDSGASRVNPLISEIQDPDPRSDIRNHNISVWAQNRNFDLSAFYEVLPYCMYMHAKVALDFPSIDCGHSCRVQIDLK